jgi:hypothetical protein
MHCAGSNSGQAVLLSPLVEIRARELAVTVHEARAVIALKGIGLSGERLDLLGTRRWPSRL